MDLTPSSCVENQNVSVIVALEIWEVFIIPNIAKKWNIIWPLLMVTHCVGNGP